MDDGRDIVDRMLSDAERNHESWLGRGRKRVELEGVTVFLGSGDAVLAFPRRDGDLRGAVQVAREAGAAEVSCWAMTPEDALGTKLHRLGFQDGWQPHWMGIDPRSPRRESPTRAVEHTTECERELPYSSTHHELVLGGDVHHFIVREGGRALGHAVLNVADECAGIYDMGVAPGARRQGYGRALTVAALGCARAEGCTSVTLNATYEGEPLYRHVGFESLGLGMTWWFFPGC